jgi:hypothetical protein
VQPKLDIVHERVAAIVRAFHDATRPRRTGRRRPEPGGVEGRLVWRARSSVFGDSRATATSNRRRACTSMPARPWRARGRSEMLLRVHGTRKRWGRAGHGGDAHPGRRRPRCGRVDRGRRAATWTSWCARTDVLGDDPAGSGLRSLWKKTERITAATFPRSARASKRSTTAGTNWMVGFPPSLWAAAERRKALGFVRGFGRGESGTGSSNVEEQSQGKE